MLEVFRGMPTSPEASEVSSVALCHPFDQLAPQTLGAHGLPPTGGEGSNELQWPEQLHHVLATHVEVSGLGIHGKFGKGRQQLHHGSGLRRRLCGSAWGLKRLVNTNIFPVQKEPACRWWHHFLTKHQDISKLPTQRTCHFFNTGVFSPRLIITYVRCFSGHVGLSENGVH